MMPAWTSRRASGPQDTQCRRRAVDRELTTNRHGRYTPISPILWVRWSGDGRDYVPLWTAAGAHAGGSFAAMARARSLASAAFAALLVAGSACFLLNRGKSSQQAAAPAEVEIALSVTNHSFLDVVIYVLHDGQQTRVGTVT